MMDMVKRSSCALGEEWTPDQQVNVYFLSSSIKIGGFVSITSGLLKASIDYLLDICMSNVSED
jgi:hypothetical protein